MPRDSRLQGNLLRILEEDKARFKRKFGAFQLFFDFKQYK